MDKRFYLRSGATFIIGAAALLAVLALLGLLIDHWNSVLWALAIGGNFWAATAIAAVAMLIFWWAIHVWLKLENDEDEAKFLGPLRAVMAFSGGIWILENFALNATYPKLEALSTYQVIAVLATNVGTSMAVAVGMSLCIFGEELSGY